VSFCEVGVLHVDIGHRVDKGNLSKGVSPLGGGPCQGLSGPRKDSASPADMNWGISTHPLPHHLHT
jgi:hypothetical protein